MKTLVSMIILGLSACSGSGKATLPAKAPLVPAQAPVALKPATAEKSETRLMGQVYSPGKMLLAFQTTGTINHLFAKPGMTFKKGQVLAELDAKDISLRAESAKLRYEQALNQKRSLERDYKIEQELYDKKISSKVQYENARTNYENADLSAKMAELDARIAQKALHDTKLTAPFDCVVTRQMKSLGESSIGGEGGNAAYEIFETASLEIHLEAPESLLSDIKVNTPIMLEFPALKIKLPGKITRFVPIISDKTRNFTVTAILEKPDTRIVPGYFVEGVLP